MTTRKIKQKQKTQTNKAKKVIRVLAVITRFVYFRYEIMMMCWQNDPDARPTFADLRNKLKEMERQHKVPLLTLTPLLGKDVCLSLF